jgi:hypothetical protein
MEKIRSQILLDASAYDFITRYCIETHSKNISHAFQHLIESYQRLQNVTRLLEHQAHQADIWKQRANERIKEHHELVTELNSVETEIEKYKTAKPINE